MASASSNQYNAAKVSAVPRVTGPSDENPPELRGAALFVINLDGQTGQATPRLDTRPTPSSGTFYGTASSTSRAVGKGAWDGGSGSEKVVDRIDAPFTYHPDPNLDTNV